MFEERCRRRRRKSSAFSISPAPEKTTVTVSFLSPARKSIPEALERGEILLIPQRKFFSVVNFEYSFEWEEVYSVPTDSKSFSETKVSSTKCYWSVILCVRRASESMRENNSYPSNFYVTFTQKQHVFSLWDKLYLFSLAFVRIKNYFCVSLCDPLTALPTACGSTYCRPVLGSSYYSPPLNKFGPLPRLSRLREKGDFSDKRERRAAH